MASRFAFLFLLYYMAILLTQPQNRFVFLHPFRIANLSIMIAVGLHVLACMTENRPILRMGPATIIGFALLVFGVIAQYFGALQPNTAWNPWIDTLVKSCIVMILTEAMCTSVQRVWAVQATLLLSTIWWLKAGIRLAAAGSTYGGGDRIMGPGVSLVENPNAFAYLLGLIIPVYLYFYHQTQNKKLKYAYLFGAFVALYSVFNTGSRTGIVVLAFMGVFLIWRYARKQIFSLVVIAIAASVIFSMTGQLNIERFKTIPDSIRSFLSNEEINLDAVTDMDEHSAAERRLKNRDTWALVKQYPLFGIGMNPDESLFADDFKHATGMVHNEMLMAGKQMGFIGIGLYYALLVTLFFGGLRSEWVARSWWPALSDMGWTFKLQAMTIFVGGQFSTMPWNPLMFILVGAASALWPLARAERDARLGISDYAYTPASPPPGALATARS